LADEKSTLNKMKASPRNYEVLKYIGTRPRTSYLVRLRNPNPEMPGAENIAAWSAKQI
jgi:molybdopterin-containing oxidoreductase family iron-sulfur binding subunit